MNVFKRHTGISADCHGRTETGIGRDVNSDQFLVASLLKVFQAEQTSLPLDTGSWMHDRSERRLLVVADGLGNFDGAKGASSAAVATLTRYVLDTMPWLYGLSSESSEHLGAELEHAVARCDERIRNLAERENEQDFLSATLAMAYVVWPGAYIVRVGNCRCYVHRTGSLHPVPDTSGGQEDVLVDSLGGISRTQAELYKVSLDNDDVMILCTDGVNRHLDDTQIATICDVSATSEELCRNMLGAVKEAGSQDNATVVAARFRGL
jgi:protein phosphatase